MLHAIDFFLGFIPGYKPAKEASICVQDVSGRNVSFLGSALIILRSKKRCISLIAYYLSFMPVSVI